VSIQVESENAGGGGGGGSGAFPVEIFTGTVKVLNLASNNTFFVMDNALTQTVVLSDNPAEAFPIGAEMDFIREGVGAVVFVASGSVVIQSRDNLLFLNSQFSAATLKKVGIDEWELVGDLASSSVFSPASIPDLATWYDAADPTTILEDDNPGFVSDWLDKSGNANDLFQNTLSSQPTTGVATINGLNAIGFDGVDDILVKNAFAVPISITLFMVVNVVSVSSSTDGIMSYALISPSFKIVANNPSQFLAEFDSVALGATTPPKSPTDLVGLDTLIVYRLSAGEGSVNLRINGVDIATDTYNGALPTPRSLHVGDAVLDDHTDMNAGELIIYARDLSLDEIGVLENTLKTKWGIA